MKCRAPSIQPEAAILAELSAAAVSGTLVMMELKGSVVLGGPMTYAKAR